MREQVFTDCRIVTRDAVVRGSVCVRGGLIVAVDTSPSQLSAAIDCDDDYLLPGLVELHTDNLERHMKPRPGVHWAALPALMAHDAQLLAAGITTVFDALALGEVTDGDERVVLLESMTDALAHAHTETMLRAQHYLHLRCEVVFPGLPTLWQQFSVDPLLKLVSVMDHSPGQRQFVSLDKYYEYYQGKYHLTDTQMAEFVDRQRSNAQQYSARHRRLVVEDCRARGVVMASHDDATAEHALESAGMGMTLAEFPTTRDAACVSKREGMAVMMGAPNAVRGFSHSGNVSATELVTHDLVDILSSDYIPGSLLLAAFRLARTDTPIPLAQAVAMVSANPAHAVGLHDRGEITPGLRADLLRVREDNAVPWVRGVWVRGKQQF